MLQKDRSVLQNAEEAIAHEWLETNGLGGWSGSTIIGCHTRRYHALLVAATVPPAERMSLVSKLDETLVIGGQRFELGSNNYGDIMHPQGFQYATAFNRHLFPVFTYHVSGVQLKKTVAMLHWENTVVLQYEVVRAAGAFTM